MTNLLGGVVIRGRTSKPGSFFSLEEPGHLLKTVNSQSAEAARLRVLDFEGVGENVRTPIFTKCNWPLSPRTDLTVEAGGRHTQVRGYSYVASYVQYIVT